MKTIITSFFERIGNHIRYFWPIWLVFLVFGLSTIFASIGEWHIAKHILQISLIVIVFLFVFGKPLNVIYGLIGTTGSIKVFISTMLLLNVIFSVIYYFAFFRNAGITYDINQPYVAYGMFNGKYDRNATFESCDTTYIYGLADSTKAFSVTSEYHTYQPVSFGFVLQNTIMTSLMQEPTDFFSTAAIYNDIMNSAEKDIIGYCKVQMNPIYEKDYDKSKSITFNWILILQVFISWIFFGVFISILYNKFRYES